jgi:hypothetical protein
VRLRKTRQRHRLGALEVTLDHVEGLGWDRTRGRRRPPCRRCCASSASRPARASRGPTSSSPWRRARRPWTANRSSRSGPSAPC